MSRWYGDIFKRFLKPESQNIRLEWQSAVQPQNYFILTMKNFRGGPIDEAHGEVLRVGLKKVVPKIEIRRFLPGVFPKLALYLVGIAGV